MSHKRSIGKLEAKIARNYCIENSVYVKRLKDPHEICERVFTKTADYVVQEVLVRLGGDRTLGKEIPDYPQGLVIGDTRKNGFFDVVTLFDETFTYNFRAI